MSAEKHGELKDKIMEYLKHRPGRYISISVTRVSIGGRRFQTAPAGTPDIIGFNGQGFFVGIEIKVGRDKLSKEQLDFRESLDLSLDGIFIEARCLEDVTDVL